MKRKIVLASVIALAILSMAAKCGTANDPATPPNKGISVADALAECGPGCHAVRFEVLIFDEHKKRVPLSEGWEAEITVDALAENPNGGPPLQIQVWDVTHTYMTNTPYVADTLLPLTDTQVVGPDIIQISYTVDFTSLPAGWTLTCSASEGGKPISADSKTNKPIKIDDGLPVGIPKDAEVFCSWPLGFTNIP